MEFKILYFIIFGGFQKNKYFFGYEDFVDIFRGDYKFSLYLGVIYMHFKVSFLKVNVKKGGIFWVAKISNIFWGA